MALVQQSDTIRIYPPTTITGVTEGDWVEVVSVYTAGMRRQAIKRAMTVTIGPDNRPVTDIDTMAFRACLLELIIKAWSDELPVTPANIEQIHPDLADWLAEEYDRIHSAQSEPEKKEPSVEPSQPSAPRGARSLKSLAT